MEVVILSYVLGEHLRAPVVGVPPIPLEESRAAPEEIKVRANESNLKFITGRSQATEFLCPSIVGQ